MGKTIEKTETRGPARIHVVRAVDARHLMSVRLHRSTQVAHARDDHLLKAAVYMQAIYTQRLLYRHTCSQYTYT